MKRLMVSVLLILGVFLEASQSNSHELKDIGISIDVPEKFQETWEFLHKTTSSKFAMYESDEVEDFGFVIGCISLEEGLLDFDANWNTAVSEECLQKCFLKQLETVLECGLVFEDISEKVLDITSDTGLGLSVYSYRASDLSDLDVSYDLHMLYLADKCYVIFAVISDDSCEDLLTSFSQSIINKVHSVVERDSDPISILPIDVEEEIEEDRMSILPIDVEEEIEEDRMSILPIDVEEEIEEDPGFVSILPIDADQELVEDEISDFIEN